MVIPLLLGLCLGTGIGLLAGYQLGIRKRSVELANLRFRWVNVELVLRRYYNEWLVAGQSTTAGAALFTLQSVARDLEVDIE